MIKPSQSGQSLQFEQTAAADKLDPKGPSRDAQFQFIFVLVSLPLAMLTLRLFKRFGGVRYQDTYFFALLILVCLGVMAALFAHWKLNPIANRAGQFLLSFSVVSVIYAEYMDVL